jgi:hypothetical protein
MNDVLLAAFIILTIINSKLAGGTRVCVCVLLLLLAPSLSIDTRRTETDHYDAMAVPPQ